MNKSLRIWVVALLLFHICIVTLNAKDDEFSYAGKIEMITQEGAIINDTVFQIASNVGVYSTTGLTLSISDINVGDKVGCEVEVLNGNHFLLTKIKKLPESYSLEDNIKTSNGVFLLRTQ